MGRERAQPGRFLLRDRVDVSVSPIGIYGLLMMPQVRRVIRLMHPETIMVELDIKRFRRLCLPMVQAQENGGGGGKLGPQDPPIYQEASGAGEGQTKRDPWLRVSIPKSSGGMKGRGEEEVVGKGSWLQDKVLEGMTAALGRVFAGEWG